MVEEAESIRLTELDMRNASRQARTFGNGDELGARGVSKAVLADGTGLTLTCGPRATGDAAFRLLTRATFTDQMKMSWIGVFKLYNYSVKRSAAGCR